MPLEPQTTAALFRGRPCREGPVCVDWEACREQGDYLIQFAWDSASLFLGLWYLSQSTTPFTLKGVFVVQ